MKGLKTKLVKVMATTVVLGTILAGCSSGEKASSEKDGPVTLTIGISDTSNTPGFKAVVAEIEKELNIKTEVEIRPGGPEGENIVKTRLATGEMTDLIVFNSGSLLKTINPEQNLVDLSKEPFMDTVMDTFKETVSDKDKVWGIPFNTTSAGAWLYNKKVYEKLGLSVPKTWDELMANNEKIKAANITPVIGSFGTSWNSQLILLADYYNVQALEPNFAEDYTNNKAKFAKNPAALRGFEKLEEVYKKDFMNKDFNTVTYDQAIQLLVEGKGAHWPMLSSALATMEEKFPDKVNDIGIFAQPSDKADVNGLTVWMPSGIFINSKTEKLEAAKKWLEFYISEKGLAAYASKSKAVGPSVIEGSKVADDAYEAVKDMQPYFDEGNVAPALEFVSPVKGANLPQIAAEVGGGITDAKKGAEMYDKDVEKQAVQLGLPGWK